MNTTEILADIKQQFKLKNFESVIKLFNEKWAETNKIPEAYALSGLAYLRLGQPEKSLNFILEAYSKGDHSEQTLHALILLYTHFKRDKLATKIYQYAKTKYPSSLNLHLVSKSIPGITDEYTITILGDSHARYFEPLNYFQYGLRDRFFFNVIQIAGATAYGTSNTKSRSGVREITDHHKNIIKSSKFVFIYFGEIDCRRAIWDAVSKNPSKTINQYLSESISNYKKYIQYVATINSSIVIVPPKAPIISDKDIFNISKVDSRQPVISLADRQKLTKEFILNIENIIKEENYFYLKQYAKEWAELWKSNCKNAFFDNKTDDTHGSNTYFSNIYYEDVLGFFKSPR